MKLMFGSDPECFIKNTKSGLYVSADGIIPGTKRRPYEVDGGAVQVDGLAAEFNINPADNFDDFLRNITVVKAQLTEMIKSVDKDLELDFTPFAQFDEKYFSGLAPHSKVLGCDPDFNIYGETNTSPANANIPFRTAAGHIHIGWTEGKQKNDTVHFADCLHVAIHFHNAGMTNFIAEDSLAQTKRLTYYGMAGSFRDKSYGVELRSPDNTWVRNERNIEKMWNFINRQMEQLGA